MTNEVLKSDILYTLHGLSTEEIKKLDQAVILITGCGGFLGQYYLSFFRELEQTLHIKKVIGIDSFLMGKSPLIKQLANNPLFDIRELDVNDVLKSNLFEQYQFDYVLHMASIASPTYYRLHPLETVDSNIWGIRVLLDAFKDCPPKGFLYYSSSEVYGDPDPLCVPSCEEYRGNVATLGPRACYDESKRFGETLCWIYHKMYRIPIRIVRLFNVYGPGLKLNDRRAPADFASAVIHNRDIEIFSNGAPMRTFCYIADSAIGELKALLSDSFDVYNIGSDSKEITILQLALLFQRIGTEHFGYTGKIRYEISKDKDYLVHDPQRRCPDLTKAMKLLHFHPGIQPEEGVYRYLEYLRAKGDQAEW